MAIKSSDALVWWYGSWIARPFVFLLIQARALQQPTQSSEQQENFFFSGPWIAFIFFLTGFLPEPSWPFLCLFVFFFLLPNSTLPTHFPHQTLCSHPQMSLQLSYKQIYFSKFENFGSMKTCGQWSWGQVGMLVLHNAVDRARPSQDLSARHQVTVRYNPLSKCTNSSLL